MPLPALPQWTNGTSPAINSTNLGIINTALLDLDARVGSGGGGSPGAHPFIVVASADAPASVKAAASFVCDGTADQVQVQSAIDLAAALQSRASSQPAQAVQQGLVLLTGGRFNFNAPAQMRTGVAVWGCGWLTEVRAVSLVGTALFRLASVQEHVTHLAHMWLNGNNSAGGSCNAVDYDMTGSSSTSEYPGVNADSYHVVEDILQTGFRSGTRHGIYMHSDATANNRGNFIRQIQSRDVSGNAIWLSAASDSHIDFVHLGGNSSDTTSCGIRIETGNTRVTGAKVFYQQTGLVVASGRHTLTGIETQDCSTGVNVTGANTNIAGLTIDTSSADGFLNSGSANIVTGLNVFVRSGGRYATQTNGVRTTAGTPLVFGQVDGANITTDTSGTFHASSVLVVV